MNEPLEIGVTFPQTEIGDDPGASARMRRRSKRLVIATFSRMTMCLGADVSVRPGWSGPYTSESMFHEPFVLFGYLTESQRQSVW
jgi:hypothetical protein